MRRLLLFLILGLILINGCAERGRPLLLAQMNLIRQNPSPCPNELNSSEVVRLECSYGTLVIKDEEVKIWKTNITTLADLDLYVTIPYTYLERNVNGTNKFYHIRSGPIEANHSERIDSAYIEMWDDGRIGWDCISSNELPSDEPPHLKLNFEENENYTTSFEKIDREIYIKADINYIIDGQGCLIKGQVYYGLNTGNTKSDLTADLIPPFSLNECGLLEGEKIDECKCIFALNHKGYTWETFLPDTLKMVESINNATLKSECEEQIRHERYVGGYSEKFEKMNEEILPKIRQTYITHILKEMKKEDKKQGFIQNILGKI